jgi:hypothetical protein
MVSVAGIKIRLKNCSFWNKSKNLLTSGKYELQYTMNMKTQNEERPSADASHSPANAENLNKNSPAMASRSAAPSSARQVDPVYISVVDKNNVEVTNGFTFLTKNIPTKYIGHTVAQFLQELFEKGYLKEELKASATPPESASEMPSV